VPSPRRWYVLAVADTHMWCRRRVVVAAGLVPAACSCWRPVRATTRPSAEALAGKSQASPGPRGRVGIAAHGVEPALVLGSVPAWWIHDQSQSGIAPHSAPTFAQVAHTIRAVCTAGK
jgi:hypothetical protein